MTEWMTEAELLDDYTARMFAAQETIASLELELKALEEAGYEEEAARKRRLRKLWRGDLAQLKRDTADLRAAMADKPMVGSKPNAARSAGSVPPRGF